MITATDLLIILLLVMIVVAWPSWNHSRDWGYAPSGGIVTVLVVVVVLLLLGHRN